MYATQFMQNFPRDIAVRDIDIQFFTDEDLAKLVITAIASGTTAVADVKDGGMLISGAATTDNSGSNFQVDAAQVAFGPDDKCVEFLTKVKLNDVVESDLLIGLMDVDTSLLAGHDRGIYFKKTDGAATLSICHRVGGVEEAFPLGFTMTNDTDTLLGFRYYKQSGQGVIQAAVNGQWYGEYSVATLTDEADGLLTPGGEFQSGDNLGTKTCLVRRIACRTTRNVD